MAVTRTEQKEVEWGGVSMPIKGRSSNGVVCIEDMPCNPCYPNPWRVDGLLGIAPSPSHMWSLSKGENVRTVTV